MTNRKPSNNEPIDHSSIQGRPVTHEEVAYRDGYVRGRSTEQYNAARDRELMNERRRAAAQQESANAAVWLIALFILALAGIGGLFFYFGSRPQTTPEVESPDINIEVPEPSGNAEEAAPSPSNIELPDINVPDVNINVPNPASEGGASEEAAPQGEGSTPTQPEPAAQPETEAESSQ